MLYCEGVNVNQRGNITKIYERLLSSNYSKYETALDLFRLVRNTSHNNGVYFPIRQGDDRHITLKGIIYDFIDGIPVELHDASRLLFFDILPELLNMIEDIVNSTEVSKYNQILDPST
jgi:hypothetical protein